MGGSNGMFEPGNVSVAAPYFISGRSGVLAGVAAGAPVARLAQLGMIDPRLGGGALQATPIRISQIRMMLVPEATVTATGLIFEVFKGIGIPAIGGTGAANHTAQKRKTTGYPAITSAETVLRVAGTDTLTAAGFTPDDASGPLDWVSVGSVDVGSGRSVWLPSDLCPTHLEAGECLEVRPAIVMGSAAIFGIVVDFLR